MKSVCAGNEVDFIGIYDKFAAGEYKKDLFDGVHPNSTGHEKIFRIVSAYLKREKII